MDQADVLYVAKMEEKIRNKKETFVKKRNIKKSIVLLLFAFIMAFSIIRVYQRVILPISKSDGVIYNEVIVSEEDECIITKGCLYKQKIVIDRNGLINILIKLSVDIKDKKMTDNIVVQLRDSDENTLIQEWIKPMEEVATIGYTPFILSSPMIGVNGRKYDLLIEYTDKDILNEKLKVVNINGHLEYALQGTGYDFLSKYFILGAAALFVLTICLIIYLTFKNKICLEKIFIVFAFVFGVAYMITFPPFTSPDDYAHFVATYQLSEKMLGHELPNPDDQIAQDVLLCDGHFTRYATAASYKYVWDGLHGDSDSSADKTNELYEFVGATGHYAAALGICLAKIMNLSYVYMIFLGRLFNLLLWIVIGYIVIKIIPIGKSTIFMISSLPMTMELVSSFSRDAYVLELSYLFIAYILYLMFSKKQIYIRNIAVLTMLLVLLLPCKYIYVLLGFLVFLLPLDKIANRKGFVAMIVLTICLLTVRLGGSFIVENNKTEDKQSSVTSEAVLGENPEIYTISDIVSNPIQTINILGNTLRDKSGFYLNTMLGGSLGSLEISVSETLIFGFYTLLLLTLIKEKGEQYQFNLTQKSVFMFVFVMVFFAALGGMLVEWTLVTEDVVGGIQGRYFLPVLPLLCLAFKSNTIICNKEMNRSIIISTVLLEFYTILYCVEAIVVR